MIKATVIGAFSAAVTYGIGEATAVIPQLGTRIAVEAVAHGLFQGIMAGVQGGDFWQGAASGALASVAASLYGGGKMAGGDGYWDGLGGKFGATGAGQIAFGTISGGAGASLTEGNFWQGAATGFVVSALNHAMHDDNGYDKNGRKINDNGGDEIDYLYDDLGNIIDSRPVAFIGAISQGEYIDLGGARGYGFKGFKMSTGAISEDYSLFTIYAGGKTIGLGLSYLGAGLNAIKVPIFKAIGIGIKRFAPSLNKGPGFRIGLSQAKIDGKLMTVFRATYGNRQNHYFNIILGKHGTIKY